MIKKYFALSLVAASVIAAGCSSDDNDGDVTTTPSDGVEATPGVGGTAFDQIFTSGAHSTLVDLINAAGLADTLDDPANTFTIIAPTDTAFTALDADDDVMTPTTAELSADADLLARVLQYHVMSGDQSLESIEASIQSAAEGTPVTLNSLVVDAGVAQVLTFTSSEAGTAVNDVAITTESVAAEDAVGRIFVVDTLLMPPAPPAGGGDTGATGGDTGATDGNTGGTDTGGTDTGGTGTGTGGGNAGAAQTALEAGGYTNFVAAFGPISYDTNVWTVFAPTDAASAGVDLVGQDYIATTGAFSAEELIDAGSITTNLGKSYEVSGTATALMIGGFPATLLVTGDAGALVYSLDGVLP